MLANSVINPGIYLVELAYALRVLQRNILDELLVDEFKTPLQVRAPMVATPAK